MEDSHHEISLVVDLNSRAETLVTECGTLLSGKIKPFACDREYQVPKAVSNTQKCRFPPLGIGYPSKEPDVLQVAVRRDAVESVENGREGLGGHLWPKSADRVRECCAYDQPRAAK